MAIANVGTYPSKSNPKKFYTVTLADDGTAYCDCPAWRMQKIPAGDRTCKHVEMWKRGE